jgi:photosystem II stability/assembly factor-like uncharacterized protein
MCNVHRLMRHARLLFAFLVLSGCLYVPRILAQPAQFERIGPYGGTVRSLLVSAGSSSVVYLGTNDGQIFKSMDGGASWALLYPGIKRRQFVLQSMVEDPINPDHLFVGGWDLRTDGGGLFESWNAGKIWNQVILPETDVAVHAISICKEHPHNMVVATGNGIFVSADGGKTWQHRGAQINAFQQAKSVAINPNDPNLIYVGTWHLGYLSKDFGKTWEQNSSGMITDSDVFSINIDDHNPKTIFAGACTGIYRSIDSGASWVRLKVFPNSYLVRAQVVVIDPTQPGRIYGGTTEGLFISQNSGKTWDRVTSSDLTVNAIQIDLQNSVIFIGTELYGVLRSTDGGRTWTTSNNGFVNRSIARIVADPAKPGRFLVGERYEGKIGGLYMYDNPINDWVPLDSKDVPGVGMLSLLDLPEGRGRIIGTERGAFLKRDGQKGWIELPGTISNLAVHDLAIDSNKKWVFAGTNDGVYRTLLNDLHFVKPSAYRFIPRVFSLIISKDNSSMLLAGTHLGIFQSNDSGTSWQLSSYGIPDHTIVSCIVNDPEKKDHLFAGTTAGLYESQDSGNTWKRFPDRHLGVDISSVIFLDSTGSRILAADNTFGGVLLSEDSGGHWGKIEDAEYGSPIRSLLQDTYHPRVIYLGTGTEGVYRLMLGDK